MQCDTIPLHRQCDFGLVNGPLLAQLRAPYSTARLLFDEIVSP